MTNDRTDEFETAVQKIARRRKKKNGDPVTLDSIWELLDDQWDLLIAVDRDGQTRDLKKIEMLEAQDERLKAVEESQSFCKRNTQELVSREHEKRHNEHMEKHHPEQHERMSWLIESSAVRFGNLIWLALGGLLMAIISYLVWGIP